MNKLLIQVAVAAPFVFIDHSSGAFAAPPEHGGEHHQLSAEDRAAFDEAHIAALKVGLKMTPAQEKNWPALATVLRDVRRRGRLVWRNGVRRPRSIRGALM